MHLLPQKVLPKDFSRIQSSENIKNAVTLSEYVCVHTVDTRPQLAGESKSGRPPSSVNLASKMLFMMHNSPIRDIHKCDVYTELNKNSGLCLNYLFPFNFAMSLADNLSIPPSNFPSLG